MRIIWTKSAAIDAAIQLVMAAAMASLLGCQEHDRQVSPILDHWQRADGTLLCAVELRAGKVSGEPIRTPYTRSCATEL